MANIELVIKISEEYYNAIKEIPDNLCDIYELVIKHGVLLPKEHGKIVDIGKIDEDKIDSNVGRYVLLTDEFEPQEEEDKK